MDSRFGSENFRLGELRGLGWEGAGLVQYSNQGQIEFTCLRFRGLSANCRHTNTVGKHTHTRSYHYLAHTQTHTHTLTSLHLLIHAHAKQREGFFTPTSICKPRQVITVGRQTKHTWKGVSGFDGVITKGWLVGGQGWISSCTPASCTFGTRAHSQRHHLNN